MGCRHASELNHSCCPNVTYHFEHHSGLAGPHITLRSTKAISPGEALNISYVNVLAPVQERLGSLRARYKFDCTCDRCQQEMCDQDPTPAGALLRTPPEEGVHRIMQAIFTGALPYWQETTLLMLPACPCTTFVSDIKDAAVGCRVLSRGHQTLKPLSPSMGFCHTADPSACWKIIETSGALTYRITLCAAVGRGDVLWHGLLPNLLHGCLCFTSLVRDCCPQAWRSMRPLKSSL